MTDTTSAAPNLLPCPFCGKTHSLIIGAASEMWDTDEHGQYPHTETYAVFCDASTDGGKGGCGGAGGYRLTKDDAIEAWNRRVPAVTPSDAEIDALAAEHLKSFAQFSGAGDVWVEGEVAFARAVLTRWGAPQPIALKAVGFCFEIKDLRDFCLHRIAQ